MERTYQGEDGICVRRKRLVLEACQQFVGQMRHEGATITQVPERSLRVLLGGAAIIALVVGKVDWQLRSSVFWIFNASRNS